MHRGVDQDQRLLEAVTDRGETPLARAAARGHGAVVCSLPSNRSL